MKLIYYVPLPLKTKGVVDPDDVIQWSPDTTPRLTILYVGASVDNFHKVWRGLGTPRATRDRVRCSRLSI